jgi:prevent-host-death family protein
MEIVNMHNAKSRLSELVKKVLEGETVIISNNNNPIVELVPFKKKKVTRKAGLLKGKISYTDDVWDCEEEIINAVEESEIFPK